MRRMDLPEVLRFAQDDRVIRTTEPFRIERTNECEVVPICMFLIDSSDLNANRNPGLGIDGACDRRI